jgi:CrcB protein
VALPLRVALPAVAAGGVLGSLARYALTEVMGSPEATLGVNLLGCLLLGLLVGARPDSLLLRAFAGNGVLGGFTTMSAFVVEADRLDPGQALGYVAASVVGGLALARGGLRLASRP